MPSRLLNRVRAQILLMVHIFTGLQTTFEALKRHFIDLRSTFWTQIGIVPKPQHTGGRPNYVRGLTEVCPRF